MNAGQRAASGDDPEVLGKGVVRQPFGVVCGFPEQGSDVSYLIFRPLLNYLFWCRRYVVRGRGRDREVPFPAISFDLQKCSAWAEEYAHTLLKNHVAATPKKRDVLHPVMS